MIAGETRSQASCMRTVLVVSLVLAAACAKPHEPKGPSPVMLTRAEQRAPAASPPLPDALAHAALEARRIDGLGAYRRPIATTMPAAQEFFDKGMRLYWAFNHEEAFRSFARAAELDPRCTLCFWGAALTLGPNYNMPMMPDRARAASDALDRAATLAPTAPPVERALVMALSVRYAGPRPMDEKEAARHNDAYAGAMRGVAKAFPNDVDVQALFAESLMILRPWKLWKHDGTPSEGTNEIVATLEAALVKDATHPGANHLYVHALEASKDPGRAVPAADRLGAMMPNAGHLVHMPSHIYERVGRYADAAQANRLAIEADKRYVETIAPRRPPDVYAMYMAHDHQFLAQAAAMQGRSAEAILATRHAAPFVLAMAEHMPMGEMFVAHPIVTMARFGRWNDVLAEPPPDPRFTTATGLAHYARGLALVATGRPIEAKQELAALDIVARDVPPDAPAMNNHAADLLAIARLVLDAKIAENAGNTKEAIARLEEAVSREDALDYDEPPDWWYAVRWDLGTTLLTAGRPQRAEQVFRADLAVHPHDGWALSGLAKALAAQNKKDAASAARAEASAAWRDADVPLP